MVEHNSVKFIVFSPFPHTYTPRPHARPANKNDERPACSIHQQSVLQLHATEKARFVNHWNPQLLFRNYHIDKFALVFRLPDLVRHQNPQTRVRRGFVDVQEPTLNGLVHD
jgi:hypothetical protein